MKSSFTEPIHTFTHRVIYGDTDAAGVVYNANFLRYFEIGRTEFMREWAMTYRRIEDLGVLLPVTECYTRFKAPAFYDDLLTIETALSQVKEVSCSFSYRVSRPNPDSGKQKLLVKGYTVHAAVNRHGKLTPLPQEVLERLIELL